MVILSALPPKLHHLALSESTFRSWARGYEVRGNGHKVTGDPVITAFGVPGQRGTSIPFGVLPSAMR